MELFSINQARQISSDFQYLKGKIFDNYEVRAITIIQSPNNQPLYKVEVFLVSTLISNGFMFTTINKFCYDNNLEFNLEKYNSIV